MQNSRKTRSERLEMPTFSTVIENLERHTWLVHGDVAASVDNILATRLQQTAGRTSEMSNEPT